jgi:chitodextrinase
VKVTGYEVYRNGQKVASTQAASYLDPDVQPATYYAYVVVARDAAGNASTPSDEGGLKTAPPAEPQDLTPPSVPTGLKLGAVSWNQISLAWAPATDNVAVKDYEIFRNGKSLGSVTATTYVDSAGLAASTAYTYKVRARDTANLLSDFSAELSAKTSSAPVVADTVAPTTPSGLKQTGATETSISLAWSAATDNVGVVGYRINRNGALIVTTSAQQLSYTDNARTANTACAYTVEAIDAAGNKSSAASLTARTSADVTPPTSPSGLRAETVAATTISLSWAASTDNLRSARPVPSVSAKAA